jgi:hypothetical protein
MDVAKKKLCGRSPQANYTDRATAACRQSYYQTLRIEGVAWAAQRIPTAVNLGFLDRSRYFFIQVDSSIVRMLQNLRKARFCTSKIEYLFYSKHHRQSNAWVTVY